jgi:hypothetical protein
MYLICFGVRQLLSQALCNEIWGYFVVRRANGPVNGQSFRENMSIARPPKYNTSCSIKTTKGHGEIGLHVGPKMNSQI